MIIFFEPNKDTYITNRKNGLNDGSQANLGNASTIDIFKLYNESESVKSSFKLIFSSLPNDQDKITIKDSKNVDKTFIFKNDFENSENNYGTIVNEQILVGLGLSGSEYTLNDLIFHFNNIINKTDIDIESVYYESILFLSQKSKGSLGDTFVSASYYEITQKNYNTGSFSRVEYSYGLIDFNLSEIRDDLIKDYNNSVFKEKDNFKALIKLKDVGNFQAKPFDYNLKLYPMLKSFEEGIGKDVIHYSDFDTCNFLTLDKKNNQNWLIPEKPIENVEYSTDLSSSFYVESGGEDIEFDITDYIYEYFSNSTNINNGFLIGFSSDILEDQFTYFVKRLGTRHLKNTLNRPVLEIKIKDEKLLKYNNQEKKYFLDTTEKYFLHNIKNNIRQEFKSDAIVKLDIELLSGSTNLLASSNPILGSDVFDYKGNKVKGMKQFDISHENLSAFSSNEKIQSDISSSNKLDVNLKFYYDYNSREINILNDKISFYDSTYQNNLEEKETRFTILNLKEYDKNYDKLQNFKFCFFDIEKQYDTSRIKFELPMLNVGEVFYEIYDVDSGETIVKNDNQYTKLVYDGKYYYMNFVNNKIFKNKRVSFKLYYIDFLTNNQIEILNEKIIVRL